MRDHRLIGALLKLNADEHGLHGDLMVLRSALIRMGQGVEFLIAVEEGGSYQAGSGGSK
jgi:hypothetical protein